MKRPFIISLAAAAVFIAATSAYLTLRRAGVARISGSEPAGRDHGTTAISLKCAAARAVLAYLREPGPKTLAGALRACRAADEYSPGDIFNSFLLAFCHHGSGDAAAENRALAALRPEQRNTYKFCFYEHRDDVADALYYMPAYLCVKMRETHTWAEKFARKPVCPAFGGPVAIKRYRAGNRTMERFVCPKCDGMIELRENRFLGDLSNSRAQKENRLIYLFTQVAFSQENKDRSGQSQHDAVPAILADLGAREGEVVADIGAGMGQFTFPLAEKVGPKGKVYAEDIDKGTHELLRYCVEKEGLKNVVPVLGDQTDMKLPAGALDRAVLIHVYKGIVMGLYEQGPVVLDKFFDGFFASIHRSLKKDGVLVLVDHYDPQFGLDAEAVQAALTKRNFRLTAGKTGAADDNFVFYFKKR